MKKSELQKAVNRRLSEINADLAKLPDETAVTTVTLFPKWIVGKDYSVGDRIRHSNKLYRVIQAHTSQVDWAPEVTPALFTEIAKPGEIPVWKQPTGAQDAYSIGDKVHYPDKDGPIYESIIDGNIWSPDEYSAGWNRING